MLPTCVGLTVSFVRLTPQGVVHRGEGMITADLLDPTGFRVIRVQTDEDKENSKTGKGNAYNIDAAAVNPSNEFVEQYAEHTRGVRQLKEDADKAIAETGQRMTDEANEAIKKKNTAFLGAPIEV